jgi:putative ABC transport system permease protein
MMWPLALRNLLRDRRRTAATLAGVALGLFALLMFLGYVRFVGQALAVPAQLQGLLQPVFAVTGTLVLLAVLAMLQHAVALNVADRRREIGLLRALGFSRRAIAGLFVKESVFLALAGALLALAATAIAAGALQLLHLPTQLPDAAGPATLALDLPPAWALGAAGAVLLGMAAGAWLTAWRRL